MKTCKRLFAAFISLALMAAPAMAQTAADPGMVKRIELARRYYAAIHFNQTIDAAMKSMTPVLMQQQARQFPNVTDAQRAIISDTTIEVMHAITPQLVERMLPTVASTFSEDELTQMVAFYESPVGQSVVAKGPALATQVGPLMRDMLPTIQSEMVTRLCAKMNCPAGVAPKS